MGLKKDVAKPKEFLQGRIAFDEEAVKKGYNLLDTWPSMVIPSECLISLSSGINAQEDVQEDLLRAEQVGKLQAERFIEERIKSNVVGFYETIKKKLKTFTSMLTTEKLAVKDKEIVIRADRDLFARLLVIREKREVSMKDFLSYSLGPAAWSLATPIGNVYKSAKSDILTCLEKKINLANQIPADAARVYDGMCIIRQLKTGFGIFGDLSDYVLKRITFNGSALIFFITDQYWKVSIKSCERTKRSRSGSIRITAMRLEEKLPKQQKKYLSLGSKRNF